MTFNGERGVYCQEGDFAFDTGALDTFWRSAENFHSQASWARAEGTGMLWAVSQATPLRRLPTRPWHPAQPALDTIATPNRPPDRIARRYLPNNWPVEDWDQANAQTQPRVTHVGISTPPALF